MNSLSRGGICQGGFYPGKFCSKTVFFFVKPGNPALQNTAKLSLLAEQNAGASVYLFSFFLFLWQILNNLVTNPSSNHSNFILFILISFSHLSRCKGMHFTCWTSFHLFFLHALVILRDENSLQGRKNYLVTCSLSYQIIFLRQ